MGLCIVVTQGGILRPLSKKFKPEKILTYSILLLAVSFPLLLVPNESIWLYAVVPFIAIFQGLNQPNTTAIISNLAARDNQGEILGINQSITALALALPPIFAGFFDSNQSQFSDLVSRGIYLRGMVAFSSFFKSRKDNRNGANPRLTFRISC